MATTSAELEQLYRERYGVFLDGVARIVRDRDLGREVVQEAFAQALRSRRRFRGDGSLEAWVWRIAVNQALKQRHELRSAWDAEVETAAPERSGQDEAVRGAVSALPPRRRLVVFLRYFADLPYGEIARICGVSEGTVAATLAQSHAELCRRLEAKGAGS
jgi:RNA polymerase sigma-70 factor (ECF subfamily)